MSHHHGNLSSRNPYNEKTSRTRGLSAEFPGSATPKETLPQSRMPSGIRAPQAPTTLNFPYETSRQHVGRGRFDRAAGSPSAVTQYTSGAEIIRMPSGSIVSIPPFEIPNSLQPSVEIRVAMFWVAYFLIILTGLGLSCWALLRAIHLL